jgi:transposase, IS5 family
MKQQTLAGPEKYRKTTPRAHFLEDMNQVIRWPEMMVAVATLYPKVSEQGGQPPIPLERMLRIYFLQLWFNLSDPAVEEALHDSAAMRSSTAIGLGVEGALDETTIGKFRHLLERNKLRKTLLRAVNEHVNRNCIKISDDRIVDATIISTPSSTKSKDGMCDPQMHQVAMASSGTSACRRTSAWTARRR